MPLPTSPPQPPRHCHSRVPTPVKAERLNILLEGYPTSLRIYLVQGFSEGFRINFQGICRSTEPANLKSAREQPTIVFSKLRKEIEEGRIAGPFEQPPFDDFHCSPVGLVPKKVPGEYRLIHHLSYPPGGSINDSIPKEFSSVSYASISDAISLLKQSGPGSFMAKTDIKSAFRIVPIHPDHYPLLGMKWQGLYYYDKCLAMGLSESCAAFERVSGSLQWLAVSRFGASGVVHILDDFLFIANTEEKCRADLRNFLAMCSFLGIPIAEEKTMGPSTTLQFAGITLDSIKQEARLPSDKLIRCQSLIRHFLKKRKVSLRDLQSLIGLLNFTCSVVLPGRAFLRRLIDLTRGVKRPSHRVNLTKETKSDLRIWLNFLEHFNGRTFFLSERVLSTELELFTDAAGSKGYGAIFGSHWFYGAWPVSWRSLNITFLEFFPIVLALHIWGSKMANKSICFVTDNGALVEIINRQTSRHQQIMILVRDLVLTSLKYNILFRCRHICGRANSRADLISRFQVDQFREISPQADDHPTSIPESLLPEKWSIN